MLTYWLPLHVTLALLGNAVFALAFAVSVVYLLLRRQLKNKRMTGLSRSVPALETLDRLNKIFLVWGFPFMTLGILTGSVWAHAQWGTYWAWEPRQITSALTWLLYGILLHGRLTAGWRGRKAAVWTIAGFMIVLAYFLWGDAIFPEPPTEAALSEAGRQILGGRPEPPDGARGGPRAARVLSQAPQRVAP